VCPALARGTESGLFTVPFETADVGTDEDNVLVYAVITTTSTQGPAQPGSILNIKLQCCTSPLPCFACGPAQPGSTLNI
jgi:hypothetical protein